MAEIQKFNDLILNKCIKNVRTSRKELKETIIDAIFTFTNHMIKNIEYEDEEMFKMLYNEFIKTLTNKELLKILL